MLARIRKAMEKRDEGLTLIELLVVMIIIGILAAIAIPVFLSQKKKAYESSMKADLNTIAEDIGSMQVDDPAGISVAAGTTTDAAGNATVVIQAMDAATGGTAVGDPITVSLSPHNSFKAGAVAAGAAGAYCVELQSATNTDAHWAAYADANGAHVAAGTCSSTTFTAAT
jgi:prepilin-type N-terminal cleavage/methylation domain-containing protein